MIILVLTFGILLILSYTASQTDTNSTSIPETYNLINPIGKLPIAKPGCNTSCGDLIVPYPFGVGLDSNCSIGEGFDIYCNTSFKPHKAFFRKDDTSWINRNISDSTLRISNTVANRCYYENGSTLFSNRISNDFSELPYTFSQLNRFTVIGCNDYAWLTAGIIPDKVVYAGCLAYCSDFESKNTLRDACSGDGCCQTPIPQDIKYYSTRLNWNANDRDGAINRTCTYAFMGEQDTYRYNHSMDLSDLSFMKRVEDNVPIVLDWAIGNLSCTEAKATEGYACQSNSICVDSISGGYRCQCKEGRYAGNPYLYPGCQDINECTDKAKYPCYGVCINTPGNYQCNCKKGYSGDAMVPNGCKKRPFIQTPLFYIGIGVAFPAMMIGLVVLYVIASRRNEAKLKEKYTDQNGGGILKTKGGVGINTVKVFQVKELKEATDNFSESKILGKGGNGTVYKGTLKDNCVVAIKKSQRISKEQKEDFINEMVILTQISHTNVVQLIGFCLETEVPLLAYEFVSNNTLHHHIHNGNRLLWDSRLRIAHESAGALAYLHTDARMPIIHRDVKSTNILLDRNYTAKIADFGASRLVPVAHEGLSTLIQGTLGYLDPEYFQTGILTDKSDVYSFGVVLAELLTGQQPVDVNRSADKRFLSNCFLKTVKANKILDIIEQDVVADLTDEQLKAMCDLICSCLNTVSDNRPSMREVTTDLGKLRKLQEKPTNWVSQDYYNGTSSRNIEKETITFYSIPLLPKNDTYEDS